MINPTLINANKKSTPVLYIADVKENTKRNANRMASINKKLLRRLIHPDYILFDWEYFSCDLEFE